MLRWIISPETRDLRDAPEFTAAVSALRSGQLVAIPTETVYGLGADATNPQACAGIYAAKGRPSFNPLIAHVPSLEEAEKHGRFDARARRLAEAFWPGPLTLVVPRRAESPVCDLATAGLDTIALRVPAARIMRDLSCAAGCPIAAPSANRSGRISATTADDVIEDLGQHIAVVIDTGPTPVGVESTIVALTDDVPRLLRPGGLSRGDIEAILGEPLKRTGADDEAPAAPGMLSSHYAPNARLRLDAQNVRPGEALLAFGLPLPPGAERAVAVESLSETGNLVEAAARLFTALRKLDASGASAICVMPVPCEGLGEAINDRLARASAPRP
ncbi:threonylcarbamoyl-AMP synthase [Rhizobiales bacterium]|uniref:L-threonylcarbamoyladenylate synthase n=1 Tax=Hongsoonwoonella zoysiae TaxID=2821844 RepID=UPI001560924C|nr:L-threonylcarbamoyladenylate synthase [Hongsoonwoonella zoysiae]NRG19694.1 threonylcarbamoyl-AMP synthase [Hongsoonwoonella zoysiae]